MQKPVPLLALLLGLLAVSPLNARAEENEGTPKPPEQAPIVIQALTLPGLRTMQVQKQDQIRALQDKKKIEALVEQMPSMTEEEAMAYAREWGAQLNVLLRQMANPEMQDPYRGTEPPSPDRLLEQAEEIVALVTLVGLKLTGRSEKAVWTTFGATTAAGTVAGVQIGSNLTPGSAFGSVSGGIIGFLVGGMKGLLNGHFMELFQNRRFYARFKKVFENELDPQFRDSIRLDFKADHLVAYKNTLKVRACARKLLPAPEQKLLGP